MSEIKTGDIVETADGTRHVVIGLATDLWERPAWPHSAKLIRRGGFHVQNLDTGELGTYARKDLARCGHFTDEIEGLLPRARARFANV